MSAPRPWCEILNDGQVGFLLELALDDQVSPPGPEAEHARDGRLPVVDTQGKHKIGPGLPGNLELDARACRQSKVPANRSTLAFRRRLPQSFDPVLLPRGLAPA